MARRRVPMHQIHTILRLSFEAHLSNRVIASSIGISHSTVKNILERFQFSSLSWPLPDSLDAQALEAALYVKPIGRPSDKPDPYYLYVHKELRRNFRSNGAGYARTAVASTNPFSNTSIALGAFSSYSSSTRF